jgi:hypothetical protein
MPVEADGTSAIARRPRRHGKLPGLEDVEGNHQGR